MPPKSSKPMGSIPVPNEPDPMLPLKDEENNRFVISLQDGDCEVTFEKEPDNRITYFATSIPKTSQGQGIGKRLAQFAFSYANRHKMDVVLKCAFLSKYYQNNRKKFPHIRVIGRYKQEEIDDNF